MLHSNIKFVCNKHLFWTCWIFPWSSILKACFLLLVLSCNQYPSGRTLGVSVRCKSSRSSGLCAQINLGLWQTKGGAGTEHALRNHLATAAQKKSAAEWRSAELAGWHSLLTPLPEWLRGPAASCWTRGPAWVCWSRKTKCTCTLGVFVYAWIKKCGGSSRFSCKKQGFMGHKLDL